MFTNPPRPRNSLDTYSSSWMTFLACLNVCLVEYRKKSCRFILNMIAPLLTSINVRPVGLRTSEISYGQNQIITK